MMKWGAVALMVIFVSVSIDATARVQELTNKVDATEAQGTPEGGSEDHPEQTSVWGPTGSSETETATGRENGGATTVSTDASNTAESGSPLREESGMSSDVPIEAAEVRFLLRPAPRRCTGVLAWRRRALPSFSVLLTPGLDLQGRSCVHSAAALPPLRFPRASNSRRRPPLLAAAHSSLPVCPRGLSKITLLPW